MPDDWQDQAADVLMQRGGMPPDNYGEAPDTTDLPMQPPIDPQARQMMNEYFRQVQAQRGGASAAQAIPSTLLPPNQRRSEGVSWQPDDIYTEMPDRFVTRSPYHMGTDVRDNPHTDEYIQNTMENLLEGAMGHPDYIKGGLQPNGSELAKQMGEGALIKMMGGKVSPAWLFEQQQMAKTYSNAINRVQERVAYGFDHERYRDKMRQIPPRQPEFHGMAQ